MPDLARWRTPRRILLSLVLAAGITAAGLVGTAGAADYFNSIQSASPANRTWMADVPDGTSLAALSIPGTHDSIALCGYSSNQGGSCDPLSTSITKTQENHGYHGLTLATQFNAGIRALDIRVRVDKGDGGVKFTIHHGTYYQWANFDDVLGQIKAFLAAQPRETVLLNLKAECTAESGSCVDAAGYADTLWRTRVFDSYLQGRTYTGDGDSWTPGTAWRDLFWAPSVSGQRASTPTLGEVRGKVVLTSYRGPFGGLYSGYGLRQLYNDGGGGEYVQDDYQVPTIFSIAGKWEKVRAHLRRTNGVYDTNRAGEREYGYKPGDLYLNGANGSGAGAHPATVAGGSTVTGVNQYLYQCLLDNSGRCPEFYSGRPANFGGEPSLRRTGIVLMDFPGGKLIDAIVARNH